MVRGDAGRLADITDHVQFVSCDVRDEDGLARAFKGADVVMHLAAINGTENFYKHPEPVVDVGVRGPLPSSMPAEGRASTTSSSPRARRCTKRRRLCLRQRRFR